MRKGRAYTRRIRTGQTSDRRGNLIHRQTPAGNLYFDYDGENHMVHRAWGANAHAYYSYDADGKRVRIHPHNETPTVFIYQGPDMLRLQMEKRDDGETVAQYTIGARGGLEAQRRGEDTSIYHFDMLGSTLALTRPDEAVTDTYRYEAWGGVLASTGNTTNRHTRVGRERYIMTRNSDLALLGLRYYMPSIGRFTTRDPLAARVPHDVTPYPYVANSPSAMADPEGLLALPPALIGCLAGVAVYHLLKALYAWLCSRNCVMPRMQCYLPECPTQEQTERYDLCRQAQYEIDQMMDECISGCWRSLFGDIWMADLGASVALCVGGALVGGGYLRPPPAPPPIEPPWWLPPGKGPGAPPPMRPIPGDGGLGRGLPTHGWPDLPGLRALTGALPSVAHAHEWRYRQIVCLVGAWAADASCGPVAEVPPTAAGVWRPFLGRAH